MAAGGWSRSAGETASRIVVNTIDSEVRSTRSIQIGRGNRRSQPHVRYAGITQAWVTADDSSPEQVWPRQWPA
jgi:hypothetical protein